MMDSVELNLEYENPKILFSAELLKFQVDCAIDLLQTFNYLYQRYWILKMYSIE